MVWCTIRPKKSQSSRPRQRSRSPGQWICRRAITKATAQVSGEVEYLNCQGREPAPGGWCRRLAAQRWSRHRATREIITALADCTGSRAKMLPVTRVKERGANLDKLLTGREEALTLPASPQAILDISGVGQVEGESR